MTQLDLTSRPLTLVMQVATWARDRGTFTTADAERAFPEVNATDLDGALRGCAEWDGGETWTVKGVGR